MPIAAQSRLVIPGRLRRVSAAALIAGATLLSAFPAAAPIAALEPPRPLPGYKPEFVTQTDQRPFID